VSTFLIWPASTAGAITVYSQICLASQTKSVLDVLIKNNYFPPPGSATESTAVDTAIRRGNVSAPQYLVSRGMHFFDPVCRSQLFTRIDEIKDPVKAEAILDILLARGLDIDVLNHERRTPLLSFYLDKQSPMGHAYRLLVERGANPCFRDPQGNCPLVAAVSNVNSPYGVLHPCCEPSRTRIFPFASLRLRSSRLLVQLTKILLKSRISDCSGNFIGGRCIQYSLFKAKERAEA
jgi:hypothetical protein